VGCYLDAWQLGAKQAVDPIRNILQRFPKQPDNLAITYLRDAAIWALGNVKDRHVVHDLITIALDEGEHEQLCTAALRALQHVGSFALPALAQQVMKPSVSSKGRAALIETLCQIDSHQAKKLLDELME